MTVDLTRDITEDEFFATYKPLCDEHGNVRYFCRHSEQDQPLLRQAFAERRVWTYHHGDCNSVYYRNGMRIVNVLDYLICEVPYAEGEDLLAEEPDQPITDECEGCGKYFDDLTERQYEALQAGAPCSKGCPGREDFDPSEYDEVERCHRCQSILGSSICMCDECLNTVEE